MENEQGTFDSQMAGGQVSIDQVTSSSDFLVKMEDYEKHHPFDRDDRSSDDFDSGLAEKNQNYYSGYDKESYEKESYDKESYDNGSYDKSSADENEFDKNGPFDREDRFLKGTFVKDELFYKDAFEHKFPFVKNIYAKNDDLINVIVDY